MNKDLKEYYIIYFDILGYKQYFEENDNHQKLLNDIILLLQDVSFSADIYRKISKKNIMIRAFSDNIIICVEANKKASENLDLLGYVVANIQNIIFTRYGLLIRGSYTKGKFYIDNNIVYGEGLIKAVALENEAKYPRIVVDTNAVQIMAIDDDEYNVFKKDVDDKYFLNYFVKSQFRSSFEQFREKLGKKIKKEGKYPSNIKDENKIKVYESIIQKTLWVVEKFDYRVTINKRLLKMELSLAEKA